MKINSKSQPFDYSMHFLNSALNHARCDTINISPTMKSFFSIQKFSPKKRGRLSWWGISRRWKKSWQCISLNNHSTLLSRSVAPSSLKSALVQSSLKNQSENASRVERSKRLFVRHTTNSIQACVERKKLYVQQSKKELCVWKLYPFNGAR